ncbi:MAG: low molecular weight phosphotyrosine protein phosphatase [Oscillospiraceae bacterium]|nr:low molecular weight phosphotyrosine protein phosphatase [Oscillospiraceae bacterium]
MHRIMFVCHGNICRSPMAEFILKDMTAKAGLSDDFYIASSAVSTEEIGNPVYPPAREELKKHNISCKGKTAVQLKKSDYDKYDLFLAMDESNIRFINRIFGSDPENKVRKLLEYTTGADVADPWYTRNFTVTYDDIVSGCRALIDTLI